MIEGVGNGGEDFKNSQGPAEMTQGRDKNRPDTKAAAACQVDTWVGFRILAEQNFPGAYTFGGKARIYL